ncbi:MAG: acyl carrier protein [bacterium]
MRRVVREWMKVPRPGHRRNVENNFPPTLAAMTSATHSKLTDVFRDVFDDDELTIGASTTASDVDGWDSLAHIRLMLSVERAFRIKLSASEIGKLKSVGDLIELVERKQAGASA